MSIRIRDIRKNFGSFVALDDVSLDVATGELVALLGPSGCGKTTLLRIIAGLEQPDTGRVVLDGQDTSSTHVRERRVGFVFQHYALFRHMSVYDNVAFGLRMKPRRGRPTERAIRDKVYALLSLVQLDVVADRFPSQLSGGQRQRVALARALAVEPKVLLLDEPFGALDAKVRKELRRWLRRLHDELHVTSVFVTHDQEEALEVSDRIVLMNRGRVEQVGAPEHVYRHPATPFVYGFLGAVNFFRGRVDGNHLRVGGGLLPHADSAIGPGANVVAYARPHELDIVRDGAADVGISANVRRVLSFGLAARVELEGLDSASGQPFEVELTHERAHELDLREGEAVRLVPSRLKVFESDSAESRR